MLPITFAKKPIKENIKPTIWDFIVQYRVIITIIFTFIIALTVYMNQSVETHQSNEIYIVPNIKLSVPTKIVPQTAVAQYVDRDRLLHQKHNPLEILKNYSETNINKGKKFGHRKTSHLIHHGLRKSPHKTLRNLTWKIRNSSIPIIADSYFTPIHLNISSNISYTDYQYKFFNQLRLDSNHTCDYLSIHGLEKSGTVLLDYILRNIAKRACIKQSDLSICNASHIGNWDKHQPLLPMHYDELNVQNLYEENDNLRFCVFTVFRDLRDRVIAWKNKGNYQSMQKEILRNIRIFARKLKVWFNFYGNLETKFPLEYYNLFYEDLMLNDNNEIKKMINYIGLNDILDENDIEYIIKSLNMDSLKENNIDLFSNVKDKMDTVCQMRNELDEDTMEEMYMKIKSIHIQPELLRKFNETCVFHDSFFKPEYINAS